MLEIKRVKNRKCHTLLPKHRLELQWIKAHAGYPGNERANKLAKDAANKPMPLEQILPSWNAFKVQLNEKMYGKWTQRWQQDPAYRMTKKLYPNPCDKHAKKVMKLSRKDLSKLVEVITGLAMKNSAKGNLTK